MVPYRCGCCAASTTTERVRWRKVHQCISIHHCAMAAVGHTSLFAAVQGRLERCDRVVCSRHTALLSWRKPRRESAWRAIQRRVLLWRNGHGVEFGAMCRGRFLLCGEYVLTIKQVVQRAEQRPVRWSWWWWLWVVHRSLVWSSAVICVGMCGQRREACTPYLPMYGAQQCVSTVPSLTQTAVTHSTLAGCCTLHAGTAATPLQLQQPHATAGCWTTQRVTPVGSWLSGFRLGVWGRADDVWCLRCQVPAFGV